MSMAAAPDILGSQPGAVFYEVPGSRGLAAPQMGDGVALRAWGRSLAGMQKEALVASSATGQTWRLASDEGPYLNGHDAAPFPLAFFTTGLISSYASAVSTTAAGRGLELGDLTLTLDSFYTMEGSALRGTMVGGALPPRLSVFADGVDDATLAELADAAIDTAPVSGLVSGVRASLFTLTVNGRSVPIGRVAQLERDPEPDPTPTFELLDPPNEEAPELVRRTDPAESLEGVDGGAGSSLRPEQSRTLHVRGRLSVRDDGIHEIVQELHKPVGSTFRVLSDDADVRGRAPDALTYLAAGVAFCFMTQLGRYASITRKDLRDYRVVQDVRFRRSAAEEGGPQFTADGVETHVHVDTEEGEEFAQTLVDMGEQTCFLHALCRTDLRCESAARD